MAQLKTSYKDDVLTGQRKYTMTTNQDNTVSFTDVSNYSVQGDNFGAEDINATNTQVNANTGALGSNTLTYENGNYYIKHPNGAKKKLGSSDGTATADQVLDGATFNSSASDEVQVGNIPVRGAVSQKLDTVTTSYTVPRGYHNGSGTVSLTTQTKTATPNASTQNITPDSGKVLSKVTVNAIQTQTKTVTPNASTQNITPDSGKYLSKVTVNPTTIYNLGSASASINVKTKLPSLYSSLTANNFLIVANSASSSASSTDAVHANNYSYDQTHTVGASATATVTKSYNASTGILTISGLSGSGTGNYTGGNNPQGVSVHTINVSDNVSISANVYCVVGTITAV